jgi:hypothetical protein
VREAWSCFFGGREAVWHVALPPEPAGAECRVEWELAVERRAVARGEQAVKAAAGGPGTCEVRASLPPVKEGVVMPATLTLVAMPAGGGPALAAATRALWLYPEDPFAGAQARLREQRLRLYDPLGATRRAFAAARLPFEPIRGPEAVADQPPCTVIVGSGVSLTAYRGLFAALMGLAARGHRVLWLAPSGGEGPFPGAEGAEGHLQPARVILMGNEAIADLDKHLDASAWPPDGAPVASRFSLRADRSRVVLAFGADGGSAEGWPWLAVTYPGHGTLVVCGFGLVEHWEAGPVPRFLLARILDRLAEDKE